MVLIQKNAGEQGEEKIRNANGDGILRFILCM
jgi:hypothetical protein